jgi:hypothetical protein
VDETPILGRDDAERMHVLAQYGAPAYVRRANDVEAALEHLLDGCRRQREEWLGMVRSRLATLHALAGDGESLPSFLDEDRVRRLRDLHADLQPRLRAPIAATTSPRVLRRAFEELRESLERFNRRWREYLHELDLTALNRKREEYNRYYVLEKECAVRSPRVARHGFRPLPPLTTADVETLLPPLPIP